MSEPTPLIQQYLAIKKNYPDELVFFQVGDFFELFFEDAKLAANELSITLTKRGFYNNAHIPLCGVPVHMAEIYYQKLVKKGYSVVICEQFSEPQVGKIVERRVSEIITPGSIISDEIGESIYTLFLTQNKVDKTISSFLFEFQKQEIIYKKYSVLENELIIFSSMVEKYKPKEIITRPEEISFFYTLIPIKKGIKSFDETNFYQETVISQFLKKYELDDSFKEITALFTSYLNHYFQSVLENGQLSIIEEKTFNTLFLDKASIRYLECTQNLENQGKENTLYDFLDHTKTRMGSRMLHYWILNPLKEMNEIFERQDRISWIIDRKKNLGKIEDFLTSCGDLEKLFSRFRLKKIREKDFITLFQFSQKYPEFIKEINHPSMSFIRNIIQTSIPDDVIEMIEKTINPDPHLIVQEKIVIINPESNPELQKRFDFIHNQNFILGSFLEDEKNKTGIVDLTIKKTPLYNYVFELSKLKEKKNVLPDTYIRVQTLTNRERYTSPELQELSCQLIHAEDDYLKTETDMKEKFIKKLIEQIHPCIAFAQEIATLDAYCSLAHVAITNQLTRPQLTTEKKIFIQDGRHPISCKSITQFVSNTLSLDFQKKNYLITGPNMGGKSTFMRQNAVIILLAHIGSFVPAKFCELQIIDKILTRVGASDSIHTGKSTFFVELEEISTILKTATDNSFVIIDEVGRGTSTYDGISLATSIIEFLIEKINPYFLCSTHYHEISELTRLKNLSWYHMNAILKNDTITFLYTISEGQANNSMGIALAKKIGFPPEIITQAQEYFKKINQEKSFSSIPENTDNSQIETNKKKNIPQKNQLEVYLKELFEKKSINDLSRNEAFNILEKLYHLIRKE